MQSESPSITFKVSLTQNDVIRYNFRQIYTNPIIILFYVACISMFFYRMFFTSAEFPDDITTPCVFCFVFIILIPLATYINAVNSYRKKSRLHETYTYVVDKEKVSREGESFTHSYSWSRVYRFSEGKRYFYIWQTKYELNLIPKRDLTNDQIEFLRSLKKN